MICMVFSISVFSQKIKTVEGEYTYVVPENVDLEKAKHIALDRVKIQLIADEFGTTVSQSNSTFVKNSKERSNVNFSSIGGSDVRGEWLETIVQPKFKTEVCGEQLIVKVWIKGKIREIISSSIDFISHVLRNGTEDKFEDDTFYNGDDLFLSFLSPIAGYIAVYLIDYDGNAYCLLPYQNQDDGKVFVRANERYVFFSKKKVPSNLRPFVDEYSMTCKQSQETNHLFVIFSPNLFIKAVDNKNGNRLPRNLSYSDFQKWLATCRVKDKEMIYKKIAITIKK